MAFRGTPAYQKAILRKTRGLNPDEALILDDLERTFAEAKGQKQLALARLGIGKELGEKRLALGEKEIESRYGLGKARMETEADISRQAIEQRYTLGTERLATKAGIERGKREFAESQVPRQRLLGIGNILTAGLLGYGRMRLDIAQAERDEETRRDIEERLRRR